MKEKLRIMISSLASQTGSLAGASRASRLPPGRCLALTPTRRLLINRCLAGQKKSAVWTGSINPKSVTYVSEHLLPFFPV
jgi:hypothetical protein